MEADKTDVILFFFFFSFYVWKEFLDIIGMWEKNYVDSPTIHALPNMTSHVLYFSANNEVIVQKEKQVIC